jgi:hypothetical protein
MRIRALSAILLFAGLLCGCTKPAPPPVARPAAAPSPFVPNAFLGKWTSASASATSITGNIALTPSAITIDGKEFALSNVQPIAATEATALNTPSMIFGSPKQSFIAQLKVPGKMKLVGGNTLCDGKRDATWVAGVASMGYVGLAFFTGDERPELTEASMSQTLDLCGTYSYSH